MKKTLLSLALFTFTFSLFPSAQIISTIAGNGTGGYSGNSGQATAAELFEPYGVTLDASGNIYIGDFANAVIRVVNTSGIISNFAGTHTPGFSGDGGQATAAQLSDPGGVTFDPAGNLYIADFGNQRIRMINTSGIITTIAGNGSAGYSGDGGPATAADLSDPFGTAIDAAGNVYIADYTNNRIRMVNTSGIISTFAGNGTPAYGGDGGPATAASIYDATGICFDPAGNLYIADYYNNRIRMVNTSGIISTFAGNGVASYSGDGGPATAAEINQPVDVMIDASGNIYAQEWAGFRIRKISTAGIITTYVGTGIAGYSGDGGQATAAQINYSLGLAFDAAGDLLISDEANNRIRMVTPAPLGINSAKTTDFDVYPNPANDNLTIQLAGTSSKTVITMYNISGQEVLNTVKENTSNFSINVASLAAGTYLLKLQADDGSVITKKIEIAR